MISDVLSEAVTEIDQYLTDLPDVYGSWQERILAVRSLMDELGAALNAPPAPSEARRLRVLDGGRA